MGLVTVLQRTADGTGRPLDRLRAGRDRYGPVDAFLPARAGHISVRVRPTGGYDITVWGDDLVAWGHAAAVDDVVETMHRWPRGAAVADLCAAGGYLTWADETNTAAAVEQLWRLCLRHDDPDPARLAAAAAENATLRRLRPWISHGTIHLPHPHDRIGSTHRSLAFHPFQSTLFRVGTHTGALGPALDAGAAVAHAARSVDARQWLADSRPPPLPKPGGE